jgi:hypothetical protein
MLIPIVIPSNQQHDPESPVHRIFAIDCSGSMGGSLKDIRTQLKNKIPTSIRPQDFMTLIWFSGRSEFGTIFEHISILDLNDLNKINTAIDRYLNTVGSTGFVQPIRLAKELALKYSQKPQVFFLSDGGENSWPRQECEDAFADMKDVPLVVVEYQYYCDRDFLKRLAELANGVSIFNEEFKDYDDSFGVFMKNSVNTFQPLQTVRPVIYMENNNLVIKNPVNGSVRVPSHIDTVWTVDQGALFSFATNNRDKMDPLVRLVYIAMLYAIQTKESFIMNHCISVLGDVYVAKRYSVCFSKQDYSRLSEHIRNCILDPEQYAFLDGVDLSYQPKDDAFNVVQLLQVLQQDDRTRFYPYHHSFAYSRISKEVKDETQFVANRDLGTRINLVYNQSRANISLGCQIHGHNLIDDDEIVPSTVFRNYTILKDGIKNVNTVPVSLSESVFNQLVEEGLIRTEYKKNEVYLLDITNLPVVNRGFVSSSFTSTDFCAKHVELYHTKSETKYLKKMLANLEDEEKEPGSEHEYERKKVDPNVVRDFYEAPELQVKISKCSTIPTVNDKLLAKLDAQSKLTQSEMIMLAVHNEYKSFCDQNADVVSKRDWISQRLVQQKARLHTLTTYLEQAKMALLIGNAWFSDCKADQTTFNVGYKDQTYEVSIETNNIKVYMD